MTTAKVYYITGFYKKGKEKIRFGKYVRALSKEDALEEVYSIIGSKHRVKRPLIFVDYENIKIIKNAEEIKDPVVKAFVEDENIKIPIKK